MDGLVSKGNKFPITILIIKSSNKKVFLKYFIHISSFVVDNEQHLFCLKKIVDAYCGLIVCLKNIFQFFGIECNMLLARFSLKYYFSSGWAETNERENFFL